MRELPSGTVTFLFTDIEGSTRLIQELGGRWPEVHADHHRLLRAAFTDSGGREVDAQGEALFYAFARARDGVTAAAAGQRAVAAHSWPDDVSLRVRMGIHTGEPSIGDDGYLGLDVARAARICSAGQGGQVLLSETTRMLTAWDELSGFGVLDLGEHHLRDMRSPERIYQLVIAGLQSDFRSLTTLETGTATAPMEVAGREFELAARAEAAVRDLRTRIEQDVVEQLQAAGVPGFGETLGPHSLAPPETTLPSRRRRRSTRVVVGALLLIAAIALVAIAYALLR